MASTNKLPRTPTGEEINPALYDPRLRWAMTRSRLARALRQSLQLNFIQPLEERLFQRWLSQARLAARVEAMGLPYRSVGAYLGEALELRIDPRLLSSNTSMAKAFPDKSVRRAALSQFIWPGDWDRTGRDFMAGRRYRFIADLWQHREDIAGSESFARLAQLAAQGQPYRSAHKGILLDTPQRIRLYLEMYLGYMENMQRHGFDKHRGKDRLAVAIDRNGDLIKLNRGLHRLAMAQVLELEEISVRVRAVHVSWWRQVTAGARGVEAMTRLARALAEKTESKHE